MAVKKTGEFMIVNRRSKKALQATGLDNGLPVEQAATAGTDAQLWTAVETVGGVKLFNKATGKVLDVMQGGTENGTWAQTWEDVDGESQLWTIENVTATYKKLIHVKSGKALDIVDMSEEDGAPAQIWESVEGEGQQWKLAAAQTEKKPAAKKAPAKKVEAPKKAETKAAPKAEKAPEKKVEKALKAEPQKALKKAEAQEKTLVKKEAPKAAAKPAATKTTKTVKK